jgi:AcrR family transcriptional regulator
MSENRSYKSPLRRQQAEATRDRIMRAMAELIEEFGPEAISNRQISERAGVTEITVYRHFPSRDALLSALWEKTNAQQGVRGGFPETLDGIVERFDALFRSFDETPAHIQSVLTTPQGRALRAAGDEDRRAAFLKAVDEAQGLSEDDRHAAAGVLQLLYSAYTWLSLREQWGMTGEQAAVAASWAARTLINDLKDPNRAPIMETPARKTKPT